MKNPLAFSLVEILVALITIGVIIAALSPVITKKLSKKDVVIQDTVKMTCPQFGSDCILCYNDKCIFCSKNCNETEYKNIQKCECEACANRSEGCIRCDAQNCLLCQGGYGLTNGQCQLCQAGYYSDGTHQCMPAPVGNYVASSGSSTYTPCEIGKYQDETGKSSCKECLAGTYQNVTGQSSCIDCEAGNYCLGGNHKAQCSAGQFAPIKSSSCSVCPNGQWSSAGSGSCTMCPEGFSCVSGVQTQCSAGQYAQEGSTSCLTCSAGYYSEVGASSCIQCEAGYACSSGIKTKCDAGQYSAIGSNTCSNCASGTYSSSGASSCFSCASKWSNCAICTDAKCVTCNEKYKIENGQCVLAFQCEGTDFMKIDALNLCVTRKNMGDSSILAIPRSITVVATGGTVCGSSTDYSAKCCWNGTTANNCNANNGGYSGCTRTLCNWLAAKEICASFSPDGKTWRLPTQSELASLNASTYSQNKGVNGLMQCDSHSTSGYAGCGGVNTCMGATGNNYCSAHDIWSGTEINATNVYNYASNSGVWTQWQDYKTYAFGVRCVSEIE